MSTAGPLLREWRQRRRLSQLELALEAEVSARHLSFVETGRSMPSRDMVLHLAERLEIPLRERNALLIAAGYAPVFPERKLDDPALDAARKAVDLVLAGHEPYPAIAVDRHWTLVAANRAVGPFMTVEDESLLQPPLNVLRVSLHPRGVAPRIANFVEWRAHVLERLRRQIDASGDPVLIALLEELRSYPAPTASPSQHHREYNGVVVPIELITDQGILAFFSTTTIFGTPVDVTLSELAVEAFFPADEKTAQLLRR
ncbi:MAG TPA: helix-turn-helix transcriptional regulator [Thermoanaerobaculia bacterium]|jgi:transcriptional regulator with XRE-family HTH domain|nr:helix-turn-helix transcriptional regulator [Thermoanaerobaculia bacterium]